MCVVCCRWTFVVAVAVAVAVAVVVVGARPVTIRMRSLHPGERKLGCEPKSFEPNAPTIPDVTLKLVNCRRHWTAWHQHGRENVDADYVIGT